MAHSSPLRSLISTQAFRLSALIASLFLLAATLVVGLLFWQTNDLLTDTVVRELRQEAESLKREASDRGIPALATVVTGLSRTSGPGFYFLAGRGGDKLAGNLPSLPSGITTSAQGGVVRLDTDHGERLAVLIPVDIGPEASLHIGRDLETHRTFAARIRTTYLWGAAILLLSGIAAGILASRSVLARIEAMTRASRSIMAGDLSRRIPLSGAADELDDLAQSLNAMLERIEQLMSGLKEVSDNIAHDLKTPLNRLRNSAEAALRDPRGPDACREGLEGTIEKADDLIKTFNALLLIARLEAGVVEETAERFDLAALVRDVAELYEPVAEEEGLVLEIETAEGIEIFANRHLIGQAVANLADNAIKYSAKALSDPDKKTIAIRVSTAGDSAEVAVADHGPGIAEADRDRALRRFVRLEKSRTKPGTGLGLSLVTAVARLHKGAVRLEDNRPGLKVVLTVPRIPASLPT